MKVLRLHAPSDLRLHDEPSPASTMGEAVLRVQAVGICGSDLHWFRESSIGDAQLVQPLVLGHEIAAVDERTGRLVAVDPSIPCGHCEFCLEGNPNLCLAVRFAGHAEVDGGLREFFSWPERNLYPLPDELGAAAGAMLEPLGVALHAVDLGHLRPGMHIGVFGCGPIGLLIVQLARLSGAAEIIATDRQAHRVEAARQVGSHHTIQVDETGFLPDLQALDGARGLDVVFEVAGENQAVESAVKAAKPGGVVILVGIPSQDTTSFSASTARRKGLTIKLCRRMKNTYPRAIDLVARGQVEVNSLVTHRFRLDQALEAFAVADRREGLKIIIEP
jgi:L-iditol 2-dehydrogenase